MKLKDVKIGALYRFVDDTRLFAMPSNKILMHCQELNRKGLSWYDLYDSKKKVMEEQAIFLIVAVDLGSGNAHVLAGNVSGWVMLSRHTNRIKEITEPDQS